VRPVDKAKIVCSRGCIAYLPPTSATGKQFQIYRDEQLGKQTVVHCTMGAAFSAAFYFDNDFEQRPKIGKISKNIMESGIYKGRTAQTKFIHIANMLQQSLQHKFSTPRK
jgi:hypothetical protein